MSKNPKKHVTIWDEVRNKEVKIPEKLFWKYHFLYYLDHGTTLWEVKQNETNK